MRCSRFRSLLAERGAALVTVLLLVSIMAIGAVVTFEALGYSIKRSGALRTFDQAHHYAWGGEQLSVAAAEQLYSNKVVLDSPRAISFPIEGGRIEGLITDKSNCFNVNSLVSSTENAGYLANPVQGQHYNRLLQSQGFAQRQAGQLVAALTDWLDSDTRASSLGAEDYDYGVLQEPYRTANGLMADLSELHLVKGYDPTVFEAIIPFLCVDDSTLPGALNVNTLTVQQAPLLVALIAGDFGLGQAIELILARPGPGYDDIADFWLEPELANRNIDQSIREKTTIRPHRFESRVRVRYYDAVSHLTAEIRVDDSGAARIVRHHLGVLP